MKKAQIQTQVFVYVVALVIFSGVLLFGYKAIQEESDTITQISHIKLKTVLTSMVKQIATDFGTVKIRELFIGGEVTQICFVQNYVPSDITLFPANLLNTIGSENPLIANNVKEGFPEKTYDNVFVMSSTLEESFNIGKIKTTDGFLCFDVINGKINVKFSGKGDHALIEEPS